MTLSQHEKIELFLSDMKEPALKQAVRFLLAGDKEQMLKAIEEFSVMYTIPKEV